MNKLTLVRHPVRGPCDADLPAACARVDRYLSLAGVPSRERSLLALEILDEAVDLVSCGSAADLAAVAMRLVAERLTGDTPGTSAAAHPAAPPIARRSMAPERHLGRRAPRPLTAATGGAF